MSSRIKFEVNKYRYHVSDSRGNDEVSPELTEIKII